MVGSVPPNAADACACAGPTAVREPLQRKLVRSEPTAQVPGVKALSLCEAKGQPPLEAAQGYAEDERWEQSLSCAAQASALSPNDFLAHADRGRALVALQRFDEAKVAYARALALDPDSTDALLGAAHLYAVALPSTREVDELGLLYAERGFELTASGGAAGVLPADENLALEFARISAMAHNDVGLSREAIERADWVLSRVAHDPEASYERAIGLFERCRFSEAAAAFTALLADPRRSPHAHYHLGLLLERQSKLKDAEAHFTQAIALAPTDFSEPVMMPTFEFRAELDQLIAQLSPELRKDLDGVPIEVEDLPAEVDLTTGEPPLSPTILGLFRGPPLAEACTPENGAEPGKPCRSIVLYRKNLGRAVATPGELLQQMKVTLLHELGHLRGEDDGELAARGLE
jgi:tetratricopeptide (TPR) repeat protein